MASTPSSTASIPLSLSSFQVSAEEYMKAHQDEEVKYLIAGTVVIHNSRALLIQRSEHDYGGLLWEVPGGSCDAEDRTVLDSARRELQEEAGLEVAAFVDVLDDRHDWIDRGQRWRKITFLVEVEESNGAVEAKLDPNEHQDHVWATLEDVEAGRCEGRELVWFNDVQKQTVIKGFLLAGKAQNTMQQAREELSE